MLEKQLENEQKKKYTAPMMEIVKLSNKTVLLNNSHCIDAFGNRVYCGQAG